MEWWREEVHEVRRERDACRLHSSAISCRESVCASGSPAYVSIRQHTSAYVSILQHACRLCVCVCVCVCEGERERERVRGGGGIYRVTNKNKNIKYRGI